MGSRISSGENGGQALVGRIPTGITVLELDAIPGHFIDMGTRVSFPTVTAEISGPEGIDDNQDDVRMLVLFLVHVQSQSQQERKYYGIGLKCNQIHGIFHEHSIFLT